jgi:hypothetical protein
MTVSLLLWVSCVGIVILTLAALNWRALEHIRRANQADHLHQEERLRVLSIYAKIRDGRCYDPKRYPETVYAQDHPQRHLRW